MKKIAAISVFLLTTVISFAQQTITIPNSVKRIEVTGSAEMEVTPDEIYIGITLQEYYNKNKAKVDIDEISRNFLATAEKAGISKDRIEVQNMSGFDQTSWWQRKRKKEQPDLMQSTSYIVKFNNPGEVDKLVNALDDNATQSVYINRTSSSKKEEYRKQLKIQALQNAKAKAQYLLEGVNEKVGGVLFVREIEINDQGYPMYNKREMMMSNQAMDQGGANEGLNFKKVKYRFEVEAHFGIQ